MEALEEEGTTTAECQRQLTVMNHPLHAPLIPLLLHPGMSVCVCVCTGLAAARHVWSNSVFVSC